ncbi:TetR family transcriptional regulator [Methylopila jiangsuensis]|uniref:TetR family transcriptional regulator n=1 Tax=Methylopila jiangsuensis TaxID=586230 RepID=A0A9W6JL59_9HYPH|nr:TetR/AcrR family transcriptional regulator [Methylopila jiangsuensis]MDR6284465.1 AcrR family transcriptional regulator [Methylopila jiangsuensis]GLK78149.1 TetR family transcriptional regulator [Methylopila jiangsuensis]
MSAPRAADTRGRIEAAALKLFAEKGVEGTSTREIAKAVGVTEGALYRHFASKDELARALFQNRYARFAREVAAIDAREAPFADKARRLVAMFYAAFDQDPDGFVYVLIGQHDHLRDVPPDPAENAVAALAALFAGAMARGDLPEGDPELATALALGLVLQPAVFRIYGRLRAPLSAHVETVSDAVLRAIGG